MAMALAISGQTWFFFFALIGHQKGNFDIRMTSQCCRACILHSAPASAQNPMPRPPPGALFWQQEASLGHLHSSR